MRRLLPLVIALAAAAPAVRAQSSSLPASPAGAPAAGNAATAAAPLPDFPSPSPAVARRVGALIDRLRQPGGGMDREDVFAQVLDIGPSAIPLVIAELERRSPQSWASMVYLLGAFGDPRVVPILRRELTRELGLVYLEILYALTLAGDPDAPLLALRSTHATTSFAPDATAMDYIGGVLGPAAVPLLVREIPRRGQEARIAGLGALGTVGDAAAVPFLLDWSRQPNPVDRRYAVMALARIGDPRGAPRVVEALADPEGAVREAATEGVGYLRAAEAIPALVKLIKPGATSPGEQRALWSLGLIGGPAASAALIKALGNADETERAMIVRALGNAKDPGAVPALGREALGADPGTSVHAVASLGQIPGDASRDRLLAACADAAVHEAGLAAAAELVRRRDPRGMPCTLRRLKDEIARRNGLDPVGEGLVAALPLAAPASVAQQLESMAESIAAPALQHRLLEAAQLTRLVEEHGSAIEPWLQVLENGTPGEVDLAIDRLADLGDPRAVEPLQGLFGRIEPDRAWRIPEALGRIGSERATTFLVQLLSDDVYRVESLRRAREEAARALARFSRSTVAADALKAAYLQERGRLFVPLLAYARVRGAAGIPDLLQMNTLPLRSRAPEQVIRHEKVNWALRLLRNGHEIPLDEVRDVR